MLIFISGIFSNTMFLYAQDSMQSCKVLYKDLIGVYKGDCKKGMANGQGEAKGFHRYTGMFKNGMPNGNGMYYYSDTVYHSGNFQDGIKEGKGETHYTHAGKPDSIIKGYWSGDEFRGNQYTTYKFKTTTKFDLMEITPSKESGNSVTIEISTNSGSPNGTSTSQNAFVLTLSELTSPTGSIVKVLSTLVSSAKYSITYELKGFPVQLFGVFSNGESFDLELYKSANWKARFFINR